MPRHFKHWLRAYVSHASHTEAPTVFHIWTGIATLAGALRRRIWIDELRWKWFPNFYIILVGPAGFATKTTAIDGGVSLLRRVDGVHFGPKSASWQAFIKAAVDAEQDVPQPDGVALPTSPLTVAVGELGTFFKTEDDVMMDVLTDLWDNPEGQWAHKTLWMGENKVESPCINLIGGTTETWIRRHFHTDMLGGGLASRIIFIHGAKKSRLVAYMSLQVQSEDYHRVERALVDDLQHIATLYGRYTLTPEAYAWGVNWYEQAHKTRSHLQASDRYGAYFARKQAHMHKLALIIAAAQRDEPVILPEDLEEALGLLEVVEPHMQRVFESIGQVEEARRTQELSQYVRHYGTLSIDELWSLVTNIMTKKEFETAVAAGVHSGQLRLLQTKDGRKVIRLSKRLAEGLDEKDSKT